VERPVDGRPRVAISSCLLGEPVRYDGGHKRDLTVTELLAVHFEWVPVCPEVDVGMGTPREPIELRRTAAGVRLVGTGSGRDWTDRMAAYARRRVAELAALGIHGYILKSGSPSCGLEGVPIHDPRGAPGENGAGAFARLLRAQLRSLPIEEETRLADEHLRHRFIVRVYARLLDR